MAGPGVLASTIGRKLLMAVTGAILLAFLVGHVTGNLLVFAGAERLNAYAKFLHGSPGLLWGTRAALLASVAVHIGAWLRLLARSRAARPVPYAVRPRPGTTAGARTMMITGPLLLVFVVYHLLHFTFGSAHPDFRAEDVYHNVVTAFRQAPVAAAYLVAMAALGLHLAHGIWSAFQTVGLNHPAHDRRIRMAGAALALAVAGGFAAIPVAILAGGIGR